MRRWPRPRRCGRSMTSSSRPIRMPRNSPRTSTNGLARSRWHLPRSMIDRSSMIPRRSRVLARSSASMARASCAWSARLCTAGGRASRSRIRAGDLRDGRRRYRCGCGRKRAEAEVSSPADQQEPEEDEGLKPIRDRLMTELTAYRTLALRDALAQNPDVAFLAAFYRCTSESRVEIDVKSVVFGNQAPGLNDTAIAKAVDDRHHCWSEQLPREPGELWDALVAFDTDSRQALFAHCVALSVNAVHEPWNRRPRVLTHADRVAGAVDLDVAAAGWSPTVDNYLGRVTKARIIQAVREAKGEQAAQLIDHLKKGEMAERAQELLACSGWLPEPLR